MKTKGKTQTATGEWRNIRRRDGTRVLKAPDGTEYRGTRQEIRGAALMPWRRDWLADSLKVLRAIHDVKERRELCADSRRDAIRDAELTAKAGGFVRIPADTFILARAAARFMGRESASAFIVEAVKSMIEATFDECHADTGKYELPLTRYERAAFRGQMSDYCTMLAVRDKLPSA